MSIANEDFFRVFPPGSDSGCGFLVEGLVYTGFEKICPGSNKHLNKGKAADIKEALVCHFQFR
ncbi:MAG: hypothetical protein ACOC5H_02140, partial [Desulfovermiculus sp.]